MRFLGLQLEGRVPDAKTVWLFRERLKGLELVEVLFGRFHQQLATQGHVACAGQIVDATFVEVPRQRNTREENDQLKAGEVPEAWDEPKAKAMRCQKGTDPKLCSDDRVKHVFGAQAAHRGGHIVRTIGLQRAKMKIGLMNLVYNMMLLEQLINTDEKADTRALKDKHGELRL